MTAVPATRVKAGATGMIAAVEVQDMAQEPSGTVSGFGQWSQSEAAAAMGVEAPAFAMPMDECENAPNISSRAVSVASNCRGLAMIAKDSGRRVARQ